jgi:hypothetical protein
MFRAVFWDILPCKMIVDRRFRGAYSLDHQGHYGDVSRKSVNIILPTVRKFQIGVQFTERDKSLMV